MNLGFGGWREEDTDMPPTAICPHCNVTNLFWVQLTTVEGWRLADSQGTIHDCGHSYPKSNLWEIK